MLRPHPDLRVREPALEGIYIQEEHDSAGQHPARGHDRDDVQIRAGTSVEKGQRDGGLHEQRAEVAQERNAHRGRNHGQITTCEP